MATRPVKLKLLPRSTIKAKSLTRLVGQVLGGDGIDVVKSAGDFIVSVNLDGLDVVTGPVANTDQSVARFNGADTGAIEDSLVFIDDAGTMSVPGLEDVAEIDATTRATIFEPYVYQIAAINDDGASDQSAAIQAQIDYCEAQGICEAVFPPYLIWAEGLTVSHSLHLKGSPPQVFKGDADEGLPGEHGTRLIAKTGTSPGITVLTGSNGAEISEICFLQVHDADAPGWTPTVYASCIKNLSAGTAIRDCVFWGVYDWLTFGQITPSVIGSGQCSVQGCSGAAFRYGINVVYAGDWIMVDDYEFQAYMLGNLTNQIAYIQANAIPYHSERSDGPSINDMKVYGAKGAVLCESNAQGVTNVLKIHGLYVDNSLYGIWNKTATTHIQVEGFNFAGQNNTGSFGIQCDTGAFVVVEGMQASFCGTSAAITTGTGDIAITDLHVNRANNDNVGSACLNAAATGKITVTGRFHRTFGANPMVPFLGAGTFVQTAVTSTGTGDYQMILKNTEDLTGDKTLTFKLFDTNRTVQLGGSVLIGSTFETTGSFLTNGSTSLPAIAQGDVWYGSATAVISALAKNTTATRYLSNTGTSNNPAWAQVDLSNGVTGDLPFANLTQGSARSVLGVTGNATADFASIQGTTDQVFRINQAGTAASFGPINLASVNAVTGTLAAGNGGTGITSLGTGIATFLGTTYATGSWTPIDSSGAGLSFAVASGSYTRIGNMVFAYATVTYPATADGSAAVIGGLPVSTSGQAYGRQCSLTTTTEATLAHMIPALSGTTIALQTAASAAVTNATMSGDILFFIAIYPAA